MNISVAHLHAIVAIVFGILILVVPRLLSYLVAIYLILTGLIGLGIDPSDPSPLGERNPRR